MEQKLLTLAIPTFNRASVLEKALGILQPQIEVFKEQIDFIVSDNCSSDDTKKVVQSYIDSGMPIHYIRNDSNIGAWKNIVNCYKMAQTKYVWVLGDDDYLTENALDFIVNLLQDDSGGGMVFYSIHFYQRPTTEVLPCMMIKDTFFQLLIFVYVG